MLSKTDDDDCEIVAPKTPLPEEWEQNHQSLKRYSKWVSNQNEDDESSRRERVGSFVNLRFVVIIESDIR